MTGLAAFAVDGQTPVEVWEPRTVGELLEMTSLAEKRALAVVPWGGGTHMGLGFPPTRYHVALSMKHLSGVVEYSPDDLVLTVRAGTTLEAVDEVLRPDGLRLACDPPHPQRATVGGILAVNASGPLRHAFGTPRDLVLGLKVAMPGGSEIHGGGKVVKNVSGYDLVRLLVGSCGTLGAIFEATFKLVPRPAGQRLLKVLCTSASQCETILEQLSGSDFAPAYLELERDSTWVLWVGLEGEAELLDAQTSQLGALAQVDSEAMAIQVRDAHLDTPADTVLKVAILPGDLVRFVSRVAASAVIRGAAGVGVVRIFLAQGDAAQVKSLRRDAMALGGTLVVERASAELKNQVDIWGDVGEGLSIMREVKKTIDPRGIFSPGRFVDHL